LYNGNIETSDLPQTHSLVIAWEALNWKLEAWFNDLSSNGQTISSSELQEPCLVIDEFVARQVVVTIYYYRLRITANFPLISHFLELATHKREDNEFQMEQLKKRLRPVIQNDREALQELRSIFHAICTVHESFMIKYASWYTCNYTSTNTLCPKFIVNSFIYSAYVSLVLTITLHYLAILLVEKHAPDTLSPSPQTELRHETEESLETMKKIGKSSLVTQKAICCIKQLLALLDTLGELQQKFEKEGLD
jgi:hypothetical protein